MSRYNVSCIDSECTFVTDVEGALVSLSLTPLLLLSPLRTPVEMMETTIHITEEDRAAMDADQLDRWQAPLPEPFNFLNGLLNEVIDDVLLTASITEGSSVAV